MVMFIHEILTRGDIPQVQVTDGGGVVHTGENYVDMFM
jgi:hypothetical protein